MQALRLRLLAIQGMLLKCFNKLGAWLFLSPPLCCTFPRLFIILFFRSDSSRQSHDDVQELPQAAWHVLRR